MPLSETQAFEGNHRVAKIWTDLSSRVSYLRRLSIVFAAELRLTIVTELYMREMSPKQFYEEFGGGSISRVDRHFKVLVRHGWLTLIESKTGGSRHGATENFYRTTELAIFDTETWSLLPYSVRAAFSWTIFKQFAERVRNALRAGTFDAREDRHFTWTPLLLDRLGWRRVLTSVEALFESLSKMQADTQLRTNRSGERPFLVMVALGGFEMATGLQERESGREVPGVVDSKDSPVPFMSRLSKVFADEICLKIVAELNLREMSVPQFHRELAGEFGGVSLNAIRARFKKLIALGWLTKAQVKRGEGRRGAPEHLYRATVPVIFDTQAWAEASDSIKASYSWTILEHLSEQVQQAMEAGTFDARIDRHLTWSLLRLDEQGWEELIAAVEALFSLIFEEQKAAKARLAKSDEEPIPMTVALAAFESPEATEKQP